MNKNCMCHDCSLDGFESCPKADIGEELLKLKKLITEANNYLSGGGCGALSVQQAAKLFKDRITTACSRPFGPDPEKVDCDRHGPQGG